MCLETFLKYCTEAASEDIMNLLGAFEECGYTIHLQETRNSDRETKPAPEWPSEEDKAIVKWVDRCFSEFHISCEDISPSETYLGADEAVHYPRLQTLETKHFQRKFCQLRRLNEAVVKKLIPLVDVTNGYPQSLCQMLRDNKELMFKEHKLALMQGFLSVSSSWSASSPPDVQPELVLDPVAVIGAGATDGSTSSSTWFAQAAAQLKSTSSSELRAPPASGGDPTFPFKVRLEGEEVLGTSGSFKQFLSQACQELQSPSSGLGLLVPALSDEAGQRGSYFLRPGSPCSVHTEGELRFLGKLIGSSLRSLIPLKLKLMPAFWKSLLGEEIGEKYVPKYDPPTHRYQVIKNKFILSFGLPSCSEYFFLQIPTENNVY